MKEKAMILIFLMAGITIMAQPVRKPFSIESRVHTGMNLPFYKALDYLIRDDIYALDLSVRFPTIGDDYWEKVYRHPVTGIGYSLWTLGNNEVFGIANALYGFIGIPVTSSPEKWSFNFQISAGGAYLTKIFDAGENHLNRAIGSHTNIYIRLGADARIRILPRSEIVLETGMTHFSNGKTRSPNYGINAGTISLGYNHFLGDNNNITTSPDDLPFVKPYIQSVVYSAGSKVYDNLNGRKYFASSLSYNIERCFNPKRRAGIGADLFYDGSIKEAMADDSGQPEDSFSNLLRAGIHVSYSQRYKKASGGVQMGYYLYSKYRSFSMIYHRVSIQYILTGHVAASIGLKSHWGKADCIEYGIVYYW